MNTPNDPNPFRSPDAPNQAPEHGPIALFWVVLCIAAMVAIALLPFLPGLSMMLVLVLSPAFVHAHVRLVRRSRAGTIPKPLRQLSIVLGSLGMCTLLAFAAYVSGGVVCISISTVLEDFSVNMYVEIVVGLLLGIVFPFVLYWFVFAYTLGYFRKQKEPDEASVVQANRKKPE